MLQLLLLCIDQYMFFTTNSPAGMDTDMLKDIKDVASQHAFASYDNFQATVRLSGKDSEFSVFSFFLCHKQWGTQSGCIISFVLFTLKYKNRCLFLQGFHLLACMAYMCQHTRLICSYSFIEKIVTYDLC